MDRHPVPMEYFLKPGYIVVHQVPAVVYFVVGSAVAVTLWDRKLGIGGLCNFQYPSPPTGAKPTARFGAVALPKLLQMLVDAGVVKDKLVAMVFGGASRPENDMGARNLNAAGAWLKKAGIPYTEKSVGGSKGRKIMYNVANNEAVVMESPRIRQSDWYPYVEDR